MIRVFSGTTADEVWRKATTELINSPNLVAKSRNGDMSELIHVGLSIANPRQRWCSSRIKAMNPAFALAEVVWILSGSCESGVINYWNPVLHKFAGDGAQYHGAYGYRLRNHFKIDQLEKAYLSLKNNPSGRQVVLQIWDPIIDFPDDLGQPVSVDIPCNVCAMLKIRDEKLEWTQFVRSNDIYLGLPNNFVQFTCLQEIIAGWLGVELGSYNHFSDSLHLYKHDRDKIGVSEQVSSLNTDSLALPKDESEREFSSLFEKMRKIAGRKLLRHELMALATTGMKYKSYRNMLLIIAADAARREGWCIESQKLVSLCDNPILRQLWESWVERNRTEA